MYCRLCRRLIAAVCVQDSRILGEMGRMQEIYANLFDLNRDLILEHTKRTTNHTQLLAALKNVSKHSPLFLYGLTLVEI